MFLSIEGGHSWTSGTASQGVHHRRFLALMVGTSGPPSLLRWGPGPPHPTSPLAPPWGSGGPPLTILALMVATPGSLSAPARGLTIDHSSVDGGRSRILHQHLLGGPPSLLFSVDGGCSQISGTASQEAHHRRFLALMMDAPGSPTLLPRGATIDVS
jgi:hypothetical protein